MKQLLSILFLAFMALGHVDASAQAVIRYYQDCDPAVADVPNCIPGTDGSNQGATPLSPRRTLPDANAINALPAGSAVRLCRGSGWTGLSLYIIQNANATREQPIVIEDWDCFTNSAQRPTLQWPSSATGAIYVGFFCWQGPPSCPAQRHGGYIFRGIRITKAGPLATGSEATAIYGSSTHVRFENMEYDNWANAFNIATDQNNSYLTFYNNDIHDNSQNGIVGAATHLLIRKNRLYRNNKLPDPLSDSFALEHALYIGGATPQNDIVIDGNILVDNSTRVSTQQCESGNITARGNVDQMTISNNVIVVPNATPYCYGISIIDGYGTDQECVRRAMIDSNTVVNVGGSSMALLLTAGGTVQNNKIIRTVTTGQGAAISIGNPSQPGDAAYCPMGNMTVKNNSIDINTSTSGPQIQITGGTGHKVFNNAVRISSAAAAGGATCFAPPIIANLSIWNYNWCDSPGNWSSGHASLTLAQGAGYDINGGNTSTGFSTPTSGNNWLLTPGVNLRNVGRVTEAPRFDAVSCERDSTPDIGAHEYGATTCITVSPPGELR
ncbi:right-handed parallel beta-helix repeat-containing protein [Piscinibacter gummiphilus]|uniref:Right-handed parallel beta-helix repeat-containing protein n=1 Tax=Piscinibacter gummiphilus TaxID=946333 RepID=A0ABZ0CU94_9BURK|nr:right-handed parallel beta-helix repeat-containing protein [Piscinibacter gummiphilus]WOB06463.1 right-handed parallel beta-helix repeat-containing protein [Piscinibacter gummiphilus]